MQLLEATEVVGRKPSADFGLRSCADSQFLSVRSAFHTESRSGPTVGRPLSENRHEFRRHFAACDSARDGDGPKARNQLPA